MRIQLSAKFKRCCLKNKPAMPLTFSNFSRARQAHFFSYDLQICGKVISSRYVQMVKIPFWAIPRPRQMEITVVFWDPLKLCMLPWDEEASKAKRKKKRIEWPPQIGLGLMTVPIKNLKLLLEKQDPKYLPWVEGVAKYRGEIELTRVLLQIFQPQQ